MRLLFLLTIGLGLVTFASAARAEEAIEGKQVEPKVVYAPITPEMIDAYRDLQVARLRMQKYRFVELPILRRQLDDEIRLVERRNFDLRGRVRDYRPIENLGRFSAIRQDMEDVQLAVLANESLLRRLKDERIGLMRTTRHSLELYQMDILRAAARVAQIRREAAVKAAQQ